MITDGEEIARRVRAAYSELEAKLEEAMDDAGIIRSETRARARGWLFEEFRRQFNNASRAHFAKQIHDAAVSTIQ